MLIDLKTKKITHQDVGQMDMYVRMYDELKKSKEDNPTIGILLCSETDEDIAKYSILQGNEQLFASKYKLYLPTEEELRAEIENQKTIFHMSITHFNTTTTHHWWLMRFSCIIQNLRNLRRRHFQVRRIISTVN